jgi:hypothetical protein
LIVPNVISSDGPSVLIEERNNALTEILKNYGRISSLFGMKKALENPPSDKEIIAKYGSRNEAERVSEKGLLKADRLNEENRQLFNLAYGSRQMNESGISGIDIQHEAKETYEEHKNEYYGPSNKKARAKQKRILQRQRKRYQALRAPGH